MNKLRLYFKSFTFSPRTIPAALLGLGLLSYGLLMSSQGFYWDEFPMIWIRETLGNAGLARYFSTNRPYWGLIYQATTSLLGSSPLIWHFFGLFWRWLSAVLLWAVLRKVWPRYAQPAAWASLIFMVYPGFDQQPLALLYSHFFIVFSAFLGSLWCSLQALQRGRRGGVWLAAGLLLSLVNLMTMEYFFLLEVLRPVLFWLALGEQDLPVKARLRRAAQAWLPYGLLWVGVVIWRVFFFPYQTQNYSPRFLTQLKADPLAAVGGLLLTILQDAWKVSLGAWGKALRLPDASALGARTTQLYGLLVAATAVLGVLYLWKLRKDADAHRPWALPALLTGLFAMLAAGWPYWLTSLPVGLEFPNNRFTLSFLVGACLFLAGLLGLLPGSGRFQAVLLGLLLALAVGSQFQAANAYRREWNMQRTFFWQMAWRIPNLQPGTAVVSDDLPFKFYSDNSLTAPLNWQYAPQNDSQQMHYILYYPTVRLNLGLKSLDKGVPIEQNYLAATFYGSTSQAVAIDFTPPACLRVLDAELDIHNEMLTPLMRSAAGLSDTRVILPASAQQPASRPPAQVFGPEPEHRWCYYFEQADLARQLGNWQEVARLGDEAFALGDYPNDPSERIPFIEGYAHVGNWARAQQLTRETAQITPMMQKVLCPLWQRIDAQTARDSAQQAAVAAAQAELGCPAAAP